MLLVDVENASVWELSRLIVLSFSSQSTSRHVPSTAVQTCRQGRHWFLMTWLFIAPLSVCVCWRQKEFKTFRCRNWLLTWENFLSRKIKCIFGFDSVARPVSEQVNSCSWSLTHKRQIIVSFERNDNTGTRHEFEAILLAAVHCYIALSPAKTPKTCVSTLWFLF